MGGPQTPSLRPPIPHLHCHLFRHPFPPLLQSGSMDLCDAPRSHCLFLEIIEQLSHLPPKTRLYRPLGEGKGVARGAVVESRQTSTEVGGEEVLAGGRPLGDRQGGNETEGR